jgi:hypothetical protein
MPTSQAEEKVIACCSFCLKPNTEVRALVAGPAVFICDGCVYLCCEIIPDPQAAVPDEPRLLPWERETTMDVILGYLPNVARARAQVEHTLQGWVGRARDLGATWAQIGDALGMTRQSAWERFAPDD